MLLSGITNGHNTTYYEAVQQFFMGSYTPMTT